MVGGNRFLEEVSALSSVCARLANGSGTTCDVVVFDDRLGPLSELDDAWCRAHEGTGPEVVLMSGHGPFAGSNLQVCAPHARSVVRCVDLALRRSIAQGRAPR